MPPEEVARIEAVSFFGIEILDSRSEESGEIPLHSSILCSGWRLEIHWCNGFIPKWGDHPDCRNVIQLSYQILYKLCVIGQANNNQVCSNVY